MGWYGSYGGYGGWAPYVSVGEKIALGKAAARKLARKEGREPYPVTIEGRKIAQTFWGTKWCENLERYHDFANRLPRGAKYVRNGSVADLVIEPGRVRAIVGGSEAYTIDIKIKTLAPKVWQAIGRDCAQEIDSLFDLLQGKFSDGVMQRLTQADGGLFPHKNEISMKCSCPDYADVCKHIAATFYGVAARLDRQPELLFKLRNVDHMELIGRAADAASLDQALNANNQVLVDGDLGSIFGIELETSASRPSRRGRSVPAASSKKSTTGRSTAAQPQATARAAKVPRAQSRASGSGDTVRDPVRRSSGKSPARKLPTKSRRKAKSLAAKPARRRAAAQQSHK